jgi:SAM-dependent methyltransferase
VDPNDLEHIEDYNQRDYSTVWQGPRAQFEGVLENEIIRQMVPAAAGWFVDLGAGYGRLYPLYAREGRRTVMVDYAMNLLQSAAESYRGDPSISFVAANAYHLPFRPDVFSSGLSVRTFHHMAYPESFLHELARVLRGGADVLLEYSNKRNLLRIARYGRDAFRKDHEQYGSILLFGTHPDHLAALAASAGLEVTRTEGTGFLTRLNTPRTAAALRPLLAVESAVDALLGKHAPVNFSLLRKSESTQAMSAAETPEGTLLDILACPACTGAIEDTDDGMRCTSCAAFFPRVGDVLDFRHVGRAPATPTERLNSTSRRGPPSATT